MLTLAGHLAWAGNRSIGSPPSQDYCDGHGRGAHKVLDTYHHSSPPPNWRALIACVAFLTVWLLTDAYQSTFTIAEVWCETGMLSHHSPKRQATYILISQKGNKTIEMISNLTEATNRWVVELRSAAGILALEPGSDLQAMWKSLSSANIYRPSIQWAKSHAGRLVIKEDMMSAIADCLRILG